MDRRGFLAAVPLLAAAATLAGASAPPAAPTNGQILINPRTGERIRFDRQQPLSERAFVVDMNHIDRRFARQQRMAPAERRQMAEQIWSSLTPRLARR